MLRSEYGYTWRPESDDMPELPVHPQKLQVTGRSRSGGSAVTKLLCRVARIGGDRPLAKARVKYAKKWKRKNGE